MKKFIPGTLILIFVMSSSVSACLVEFHLDRSAAPAQEVLISGTFNGWADSEAEGAFRMEDSDGNQVWEYSTNLPVETYLYKFIVDGEWIPDPDNPEQSPGVQGEYNSVLNVDCAEPRLEILFAASNPASRVFTASLRFLPGESGLPMDESSIHMTLDWEPVPDSRWVVIGDQLNVNIPEIAPGIHDIRVNVSDTGGEAAETILLKAIFDVSSNWRDAVLYFVMLDRFCNGDPSNDAPVPGLPDATNYQGGDLQGLLDKINEGYFTDLGVNTIWMTWPGDNPDDAEWGAYVDSDDCQIPQGAPGYPKVDVQFSGYHGYWPRNLYQVDEHLGDMALLREVVSAAHARNIRVLLDLPVNHVHDSSPFFTDHPQDYFNMDPIEICEETNWAHPQTCWFTEFLPDIHYENLRAVRDVLRMASWWVEETGCDGFRVDALKHVSLNFIEALRFVMDQKFSRSGVLFYLLGETFTGDPYEIVRFQGDDMVYGQFDFPLNLHLLKTFTTFEETMEQLYGNTRNFQEIYLSEYPGAIMSSFLGNHDIARFLSMAAGDITCGVWDNISHIAQGWRNPPGLPAAEQPYALMRLAFTYIMTLPEIPLIYYGDEFGMPGANDPDNRRFMQFGDALSALQKANLAYMRKLTAVRNAHPVLRHAVLGPSLYADESFLAFPRVSETEQAAVMLNRSDSSRTVSVPVTALGLRDGDTLTDALSGETISVQNNTVTVTLDGLSAAIYFVDVSPTPTPRPTSTPVHPTPSPEPTVTPSPTPIDLNVSIYTNRPEFHAGDTFRLTRRIHNGGEEITAAVFTLLEVAGTFLYWPDWTDAVDYRTMRIDARHDTLENLLEFQWPDGAGSGSARFWAALTTPIEFELLAEVASYDFTWN